MNEYEIVRRGRYRDIEWTVLKYGKKGLSKYYDGIACYSGRVKPFFLIGKEWMRMDKVQMCTLTKYYEYVGTDETTSKAAKATVKRMIDFMWDEVDEEKRIYLYKNGNEDE